VAYLSEAEQRRRVVKLVRRKHGVRCPNLHYNVMDRMGPSAQLSYRCTDGDAWRDIDLTDEEAEYLGLDRNSYGSETYPY
jgi:hypothetical protein